MYTIVNNPYTSLLTKPMQGVNIFGETFLDMEEQVK